MEIAFFISMANIVVERRSSEKQPFAYPNVCIREAVRECATLRSGRLMRLVKDRYVKRRESPYTCDATGED